MGRERAATAGCVAALAGVNAWIMARLFRTEYTEWMSSIEGAYIGLARWIGRHWTELDWFPLWYGGIPFENAYPPLLHVVVAATAQATGMSEARAYHVACGAMYCMGPVALFWLTWRLSGSKWKGLVAGFVASLLSPSAFLLPSVAKDVTGVWMARRMQAMVGYGEGPHVASMTLLLVALVSVHAALEGPLGWRVAMAALAVASVPLTNWLGGAALAAAVLALVLARNEARLGRVIAIGILAYALAAPWIKPSLVAAVQRNSQMVGGYKMGVSQYVLMAAWLGAAVAAGYLLRRTRLDQAWRFALVFLLLMAAPPLVFEWWRVYPLPQPDRYHLEMELAIAIVMGLLLGRPRKWVVAPVALALAILLVVQVPRWRFFARIHTEKFDVTRTLEWEAARLLEHNLSGARVFVVGSTKFWLNAFSDNPQLAGGFDQGLSNPQLADVTFAIPYWQERGADSVLLLKAYGVRAVLASGERTRDSYRNYRDPAQFRGLLKELWRSGDDVIYEVPARSDALARVVRREDLVNSAVLKPDLDRDSLTRYVAAIEGRAFPEAYFTWTGTSRARIEAELQRDHVLSVPVTWDSGWRAEVNGQPCAIWRDGLGLIAIAPHCEGRCIVELAYGGAQAKVAAAIFAIGLAACFAIIWFGSRR